MRHDADVSTRSTLVLDGRRVTYRDSGGAGPVLLALHGHFGHGSIFDPLAAALGSRYRIIAPDQRAHGHTERGSAPLTPETYATDAAALLNALGVHRAAVLGHSMGGAVAWTLAARHPNLVSSLVIADMTIRNEEPETRPVLDITNWPRRAESRAELRDAIESHGIPDAAYFLQSAVEYPDGWGLLFDAADLMASQHAFTGDFTDSWTASGQPALLLHAGRSMILTEATARHMAAIRPATELQTLPDCGHWLYDDAPDRFAAAVAGFLDSEHQSPFPGPVPDPGRSAVPVHDSVGRAARPELQQLRADHAPALLAFERENREYFAASVPDRGDAYFTDFDLRHAQLLNEQDAGEHYFHVLVADEGAVFGRVNLVNIADESAELGFRIAQRAAGSGLATHAVHQVCDLAVNTYGLTHLRAATTLDNPGSRAVLERTGFVPVGPTVLGGREGIRYRLPLPEDRSGVH